MLPVTASRSTPLTWTKALISHRPESSDMTQPSCTVTTSARMTNTNDSSTGTVSSVLPSRAIVNSSERSVRNECSSTTTVSVSFGLPTVRSAA